MHERRMPVAVAVRMVGPASAPHILAGRVRGIAERCPIHPAAGTADLNFGDGLLRLIMRGVVVTHGFVPLTKKGAGRGGRGASSCLPARLGVLLVLLPVVLPDGDERGSDVHGLQCASLQVERPIRVLNPLRHTRHSL